jgi:hypothetical protein
MPMGNPNIINNNPRIIWIWICQWIIGIIWIWICQQT